jgi:hypothetical protein
MAYIKKAKNSEGLRAEAINTELTTNRFSQRLKAIREEAQAPKIYVVEQVLSELPSDPSRVPPEFLQQDPAEIAARIESEKVETKPGQYQVKPGTEVTKNLLADLDRLKDKLGGAPNFRNGIPTLNDEDAHRTFMGQPMPAVKDWFRMTLQKKWSPEFFWSSVAKMFNVTNNTTPYEEAHIRIQRFGILSANKDRVFEILDNGSASGNLEFNTMTGLAWHPADNGPGIEKYYIKMVDDFLTVYYEDAKARGDDALIEYYKAYQGVCFEDRAKIIEQYMASHPTLAMEAEAQSKGEEAMDIDPADIASYDENTKINDVIYAECGELTKRRNGVTPNPQDLWDHLVKKGVAGREFPDGTGNKAKITVDYLNSDDVRTDLIDVVMVLEDGPKIVKAVEMPKNIENVADYGANADVQKVIFEEIKELTIVNGGNTPTPQELWDRLEEKGIAGRKFAVSPGSQEQIELSADYLNKDSVREDLIDDFMVLEDGPKIVAKAASSDKESPIPTSDEDLDHSQSTSSTL